MKKRRGNALRIVKRTVKEVSHGKDVDSADVDVQLGVDREQPTFARRLALLEDRFLERPTESTLNLHAD